MDQTLGELYTRYVRAAEYFNALVERKYTTESVRALFRMKVLSEQKFPQWWADVSKDQELRDRWLERFEDPEGSFKRNCERIKSALDQIPIRRVAA